MAARSLFDQLASSFSNAVADVREKLVEEAWFGRTAPSQERMTQDVSNAVGTQHPAAAMPMQFDRLLGEFVPARTDDQQLWSERDPRRQSMTFDEMASQMAGARANEPDHEIDRDRD